MNNLIPVNAFTMTLDRENNNNLKIIFNEKHKFNFEKLKMKNLKKIYLDFENYLTNKESDEEFYITFDVSDEFVDFVLSKNYVFFQILEIKYDVGIFFEMNELVENEIRLFLEKYEDIKTMEIIEDDDDDKEMEKFTSMFQSILGNNNSGEENGGGDSSNLIMNLINNILKVEPSKMEEEENSGTSEDEEESATSEDGGSSEESVCGGSSSSEESGSSEEEVEEDSKKFDFNELKEAIDKIKDSDGDFDEIKDSIKKNMSFEDNPMLNNLFNSVLEKFIQPEILNQVFSEDVMKKLIDEISKKDNKNL